MSSNCRCSHREADEELPWMLCKMQASKVWHPGPVLMTDWLVLVKKRVQLLLHLQTDSIKYALFSEVGIMNSSLQGSDSLVQHCQGGSSIPGEPGKGLRKEPRTLPSSLCGAGGNAQGGQEWGRKEKYRSWLDRGGPVPWLQCPYSVPLCPCPEAAWRGVTALLCSPFPCSLEAVGAAS